MTDKKEVHEYSDKLNSRQKHKENHSSNNYFREFIYLFIHEFKLKKKKMSRI